MTNNLCLKLCNADLKQNQLLILIAHELKNSLTTIPAYAQLIQRMVKDNIPASQMCTYILSAANRMENLIKEFLEVSQSQATEVKLKKNDFDIASIISRVAAANAVLADAKQQTILLDIAAGTIINADEIKIAEIADNLINNAIKYSPAGAVIQVKLTTGKEKVIVEIIDEGPGFNREDKEKMFLPFTRLSARPTAGENSTGIGLSIVKLLVDAHGGLVFAENNPGKRGAIFKIEIPFATI